MMNANEREPSQAEQTDMGPAPRTKDRMSRAVKYTARTQPVTRTPTLR